MNIREAKQEIMNALRVYHRKDARGNYKYPLVRQRPILLIGPPGIGKTAIVEQIARECRVGLVSYTITHHTRQSAIGLPKIVEKQYQGRQVSITEYTLSEIIASVYECMERTGKKEGILFIDEINCVSETLAPTMLQFLQNKTFGSHRIPEGWMIVAAGNPPEYNKSVREFDIVTLDRVRRIEIAADCRVWMEYAREQQVHGAILSYLTLKEDRFYQVEQQGDQKAFVTARGWEDLSELLKGYEELGLEVTADVAVQFLQQEKTARDFAAYLRLYHKYGMDYGIEEILSGEISQESRQEKVQMAKNASFEERFTVAGLLLDGLGTSLNRYWEQDRRVLGLRSALLKFRNQLKEQEDILWLEKFTENRRESLKIKQEQDLISRQEWQEEDAVNRRLEDYDALLKARHIRDKAEGFEVIKQQYDREAAERGRRAADVKARLERAFAFAADCFGEEGEVLLLVSGLTENPRAMEFIELHGSPVFLQYGRQLVETQPKDSLQRACIESLAQQ